MKDEAQTHEIPDALKRILSAAIKARMKTDNDNCECERCMAYKQESTAVAIAAELFKRHALLIGNPTNQAERAFIAADEFIAVASKRVAALDEKYKDWDGDQSGP